MAIYAARFMKLKDWLHLRRKHSFKDLNGRFIAYDIGGEPIGKIVYKEGRVVSHRIFKKEGLWKAQSRRMR